MKLTMKDKIFLERLKSKLDEGELVVEFKEESPKRFVLRRNYGTRIESYFRITRQGIRWRMNRLMNDIYVNAYLTILWIESNFGKDLRQKAMAIAQERYQEWKKTQERVFTGGRKFLRRSENFHY